MDHPSAEATNGHSNQQKGKEPEKVHFTWEDIKFIIAMTVCTIGFSLRGGEFPGSLYATLRQVFASLFYGFGIVFLFIGITKNFLKYRHTKVHIVKWAFALAAIFAISQFFHEGYLMLTGQLPAPK